MVKRWVQSSAYATVTVYDDDNAAMYPLLGRRAPSRLQSFISADHHPPNPPLQQPSRALYLPEATLQQPSSNLYLQQPLLS